MAQHASVFERTHGICAGGNRQEAIRHEARYCRFNLGRASKENGRDGITYSAMIFRSSVSVGLAAFLLVALGLPSWMMILDGIWFGLAFNAGILSYQSCFTFCYTIVYLTSSEQDALSFDRTGTQSQLKRIECR